MFVHLFFNGYIDYFIYPILIYYVLFVPLCPCKRTYNLWDLPIIYTNLSTIIEWKCKIYLGHTVSITYSLLVNWFTTLSCLHNLSSGFISQYTKVAEIFSRELIYFQWVQGIVMYSSNYLQSLKFERTWIVFFFLF